MSYLKHFESHDILISATRYYIGRRTIQTAYHARCLARAWHDLPRAEGREFYPLGEDFDRREWELVRKQWMAGEGK